MAIETFDTVQTELQIGINLLEAGAGTGKTYAIAMLVLRLIVEKSIDIKQILIVTFTKAATEELKDRIRKRLSTARQALENDAPNIDGTLRIWLDGLETEPSALKLRLDRSLLDIDQAQIFTIHGFCQRILAEHALESGQLFDAELSENVAAIRQNCADDFWRKQLYPRPAWQVGLLTAFFPSPDSLLSGIAGIDLQQTVYPDECELESVFSNLENLIATAAKHIRPILQILESAFSAGRFNDSYVRSFSEKSEILHNWLQDPSREFTDFTWLTTQGLLVGLNGRKFMVSKNQPLSSEQQKRNYLVSLQIDSTPFDLMSAELQKLQVAFRLALLKTLRKDLDKTLQNHNVFSFDSLISRLAEALNNPDSHLLTIQLRQRYKAALIDEFQDTDVKQWQIFSSVFATSEHFLYLVGDPKQAIYKFRGADIFAYFSACRQADQHYTLQRNWRSHPDLVAGVNRLFSRNQAFLLESLYYFPLSAAYSRKDGRIGDTPPLILWQLEKNDGKLEHWSAGAAGSAIRNAIVSEILQLLKSAKITTASTIEPVLPKDIAILVRSNEQAAEYQQSLNSVGIPAVLNSKQSVFATPEAMEIYTVLQAAAQPGNVALLKQALTVTWFDLDGQQLCRLSNDDNGLENWLNRFQDYHRLWHEQGLFRMMRHLLEQENVEQYLCSIPRAERALTNLHHLMELLQEIALEEHLSINKTLDWLRRAICQTHDDRGDNRQLRLESDEDAVKIMTLHGSKGLEYPLVFCPNLWQRSNRLKTEQNLIQCHENGEIIADLGSELFTERRERALQEELAEELRLLYVAATRAKYRCYICWADVRTKDKANDSALAYLLEFQDTDFSIQAHTLAALATELPQAFEFRQMPAETGNIGLYQTSPGTLRLSYRQQRRNLLSHWQMSSYTALSALSPHGAPELPVDKAVEAAGRMAFDDFDAAGPFTNNSAEGLPKGAQTGNVIHTLLETIAFKELADGADIRAAREQAMCRYGLHIENPESIDRLLRTVVTAPLEADGNFRLQHLHSADCIKEMPFYLSLRTIDTQNLNRILSACPAYQPLSGKQMSGYLTGFIDLICAYRGKFYVLDYKSNSLPDYRTDTLLKAMREHNYGLQYWLYSVVLDHYLQQRLANYDYNRHFGGIKYLFVRGMCDDTPGQGVFSDLPEKKLVRELAKMFFSEN